MGTFATNTNVVTPLVNGAAVSASNPLPTTAVAGGGVATNRSGTLTSGGTGNQVLFPAQARTNGFVQNQSTGDLWLRWDGTDAAASQPSFWLPAGAFVNLSDLGISSQAVKVYGATTGQTISAWEW